MERKLANKIKTFDGCKNVREMKNGSGHWSVHSWALAFDLNALTNAYGDRDFDMPDEVAVCFAEEGFEWGGLWSTPDAMHVQLCHIRDWSQDERETTPWIYPE